MKMKELKCLEGHVIVKCPSCDAMICPKCDDYFLDHQIEELKGEDDLGGICINCTSKPSECDGCKYNIEGLEDQLKRL